MSFSNLDPSLAAALQQMFADASGQGFSIQINSGFRSPEQQASIISNNWHKFDLKPEDRERWNADVKSMGAVAAGDKWSDIFTSARRTASDGAGTPMRNWIALPGSSNHQRGVAADLGYGSSAARDWAHENAGEYGIAFPLSNEPWHAELASARMNAESGQHNHGDFQPTIQPEGASRNVDTSVALTEGQSAGPLEGPPASSNAEFPVDASVQGALDQSKSNTLMSAGREFAGMLTPQQLMAEQAMFNRALSTGETNDFQTWFSINRMPMYVALHQSGDPEAVSGLTQPQLGLLARLGSSSQGDAQTLATAQQREDEAKARFSRAFSGLVIG